MEHRRLGKSALVVSDICMGTMTFGSQTEEAEVHRILDKCLDAGINFFDTAEGYPVPPDIKWVGRTEEIVGRWMKGKNRDAIIMATKILQIFRILLRTRAVPVRVSSFCAPLCSIIIM